YARKRIVYLWPFLITISRCRTCASHAFAPLLSTWTHRAPSSTAALPSPGAENEVVQGRLLPSENVGFFTRLPPPAARSGGAAAGPAPPSTLVVAQPAIIVAASAAPARGGRLTCGPRSSSPRPWAP